MLASAALGLAGLAALLAWRGPRLPPGTERTIARIRAGPVTGVVNGISGYAQSGGVRIWYESIPPESRRPENHHTLGSRASRTAGPFRIPDGAQRSESQAREQSSWVPIRVRMVVGHRRSALVILWGIMSGYSSAGANCGDPFKKSSVAAYMDALSQDNGLGSMGYAAECPADIAAAAVWVWVLILHGVLVALAAKLEKAAPVDTDRGDFPVYRYGCCQSGAESGFVQVVGAGGQHAADTQEDVALLVVPFGTERWPGRFQDAQNVVGACRRIGFVGKHLDYGAAICASRSRLSAGVLDPCQ